MWKKQARLDAIRAILSVRDTATQKEIVERLEKAGFKTSQPVLSTDLASIGAVKLKTPKGYRYTLQKQIEFQYPRKDALTHGVRYANVDSIMHSGNITIIRTRIGFAQAIAAEIDWRRLNSVIGTIAGTDTVLIVRAEDVTREEMIKELADVVPAISTVSVVQKMSLFDKEE